MSVRAIFALLIVLWTQTGCATITKGTTQVIALDTPGVPGAKCTLSSSSVGQAHVVTPASVNLQKGAENISVRCTKECYNDGHGIIGSNVEAMTAGNLLVGGVVGLGVDAVSGAMNKYNEQNQISMVPIAGCRPRSA